MILYLAYMIAYSGIWDHNIGSYSGPYSVPQFGSEAKGVPSKGTFCACGVLFGSLQVAGDHVSKNVVILGLMEAPCGAHEGALSKPCRGCVRIILSGLSVGYLGYLGGSWGLATTYDWAYEPAFDWSQIKAK